LDDAIEFEKHMKIEPSLNFKTEIILIKGLYEIPETDENRQEAVRYQPELSDM